MSQVRAEVLSIKQRFHAELRALAEQRGLREGVVALSLRPVMEWSLFEQLYMLGLVNEYRRAAGRELVTLDDIALADRLAAGHVDYGDQFSLACAVLTARP